MLDSAARMQNYPRRPLMRTLRLLDAINNIDIPSTIDKTLEARLYQQQYPSNIVECYKLNDYFDNVEQWLERWSSTGELSCPTLDLQLTGDHLCG